MVLCTLVTAAQEKVTILGQIGLSEGDHLQQPAQQNAHHAAHETAALYAPLNALSHQRFVAVTA